MNNESPWAGQHDTPLDRAIDRAVRDMMQVDPPPGLRRRVLSRLEAPSARRSFVFAPYSWAAAALMILVIGMIIARDRTIEPAAVPAATSQVVRTPAPDSSAAQVQPPPLSPSPQAPAHDRITTSPHVTHEAIQMPRVGNVFGPRSPAVTAADASAGSVRLAGPVADAPVPVPTLVVEPLLPTMLETPEIVTSPLVIAAPALEVSTRSPQETPRPSVETSQGGRPPITLTNIRIELTIVDQRPDTPGPPAKTLTLLVEDRKTGRIRTSRGNAALNVDVSPEIVREGKIRVMLSVDYNPQDSPDRAAPLPIQQAMTAVLDDGKPLVISLSADPSSDRKVRLEVKASIVR